MVVMGEKKMANKKEARLYHRRELEKQGITIGCRPAGSAKKKRGDSRQGKCLVCGKQALNCECDDRDEWTKARIG